MKKTVAIFLIGAAATGMCVAGAGISNADTGSSSADPIGDFLTYSLDPSASNGYRWRDDSHRDTDRVVGSWPNMWGPPTPVYAGEVYYFEKRLDCQAGKYTLDTGQSGIPFMRNCAYQSDQRAWYFAA
jgi:hypothetical protein